MTWPRRYCDPGDVCAYAVHVAAERDSERTVDPAEFIRALLNIRPEDAEKVRKLTPSSRQKPEKQIGQSAGYGNDDK